MNKSVVKNSFENSTGQWMHELKTPLTVIIGYSELLLNSDCGQRSSLEQRQMLNLILKSASQLDEVIDALMEVDRRNFDGSDEIGLCK